MSTDRRVEADRQTYSLFRESSNVALQTSTDLKGLKVVMVRRLAAQEHSAAHVQLASCIAAVMKFGAGADDDPIVKVRERQHYRNRLRACTSQCASIELERQF